MPTLRERYDALQALIERAANAIRDGDTSLGLDLDLARKERDRLAALLDAQSSTGRTTRTLLQMEDE